MTETALGYNDKKHICLVAGTRGGKGTSVIIPNLCTWLGSVVVIDPKAENATVTAARRGKGSEFCEGLGQAVHVLDPFRSASVDEEYRSSYNPLDVLDPDNPEIIDLAAIIADALVVVREQSPEPFWNESARGMVKALILHVATSSRYEGRRNLVTLRELLTRGDWKSVQALQETEYEKIPSAQQLLWQEVQCNEALNGVVSGLGDTYLNMLQKNDRGFDGVLQTAVTNTEFLDSPGLQECLKQSDFALSDLKTDERGVSVYLSLPQRYMPTHYRWLRMMISLITSQMETTKGKPKCGHDVLMVLDEFAGLKHMESIENAVAQIAGYGVRMFFVLQSLEQLKGTYKDKWQTFLANTGLKIFFGLDAADQLTAPHISKMLGETEVRRDTATSSQTTGTNKSKAVGTSTARTKGTSYSEAESASRSRTHGESESETHGSSESNTKGTNQSHTTGTNRSRSISKSLGQSYGRSSSENRGFNTSRSLSRGSSGRNGLLGGSGSEQWNSSEGDTSGESHGYTSGSNFGINRSRSKSFSEGQSDSHTTGESFSQTFGLNQSYTSGSSSSETEGESTSRTMSENESETFTENQSQTTGSSKSKTKGTNEHLYHRPLITPDELDLHLAEIKEKENRLYPGLALIVSSGQRATAVQRCNYFEDEYFIGWYEGHPDYLETAPPPFIVEKDVIGLPDLSWGNSLGEYVGEGGLKIEEWYTDLETEVSKGDLIAKVGAFALHADNPFTKEAVDEVESLDVEVCDDSTINLGIRSPHDGVLVSRLDEYRHDELGKLRTNRRKLHFESSEELPTPLDALTDYVGRYLGFLEKRASEEEAKLIAAEKRRLAAIKREEEKRKRREAERLKAEREAEEERKRLELEEQKRREEEGRQRAIALKRAQEERLRLKKLAIKKRAKQIYWQRLQRKTIYYGKRSLIGVGAIAALVLVVLFIVNVDFPSTSRTSQKETSLPAYTPAPAPKSKSPTPTTTAPKSAVTFDNPEVNQIIARFTSYLNQPVFSSSYKQSQVEQMFTLLKSVERTPNVLRPINETGTLVLMHSGNRTLWVKPKGSEGTLLLREGSESQMRQDLVDMAAGLNSLVKDYKRYSNQPIGFAKERSRGSTPIFFNDSAEEFVLEAMDFNPSNHDRYKRFVLDHYPKHYTFRSFPMDKKVAHYVYVRNAVAESILLNANATFGKSIAYPPGITDPVTRKVYYARTIKSTGKETPMQAFYKEFVSAELFDADDILIETIWAMQRLSKSGSGIERNEHNITEYLQMMNWLESVPSNTAAEFKRLARPKLQSQKQDFSFRFSSAR